MAKNRMIRPETWTDDKFVILSPYARLLFIGMWNYACDNGHLDDSALQLKMRILPADDVDVSELLQETLNSGMVTRGNGYLKVVNLARRQPLDSRFLVFCAHCDNDREKHYSPGDKKPARATHASNTSDAREQHEGARREHDEVLCSGDGDVVVTSSSGDGDVVVNARASGRKRPARPIPNDWEPTDTHAAYATQHGLDISAEVFKFRNHALGADKRQVDWNATFSTWLAKAREYRPAPPKLTNHQRGIPEGW